MSNDADRLKQARAEYQTQKKQIQQDKRLSELIDDFRANPFKLAILITIVIVMLALVVFG